MKYYLGCKMRIVVLNKTEKSEAVEKDAILE